DPDLAVIAVPSRRVRVAGVGEPGARAVAPAVAAVRAGAQVHPPIWADPDLDRFPVVLVKTSGADQPAERRRVRVVEPVLEVRRAVLANDVGEGGDRLAGVGREDRAPGAAVAAGG